MIDRVEFGVVENKYYLNNINLDVIAITSTATKHVLKVRSISD